METEAPPAPPKARVIKTDSALLLLFLLLLLEIDRQCSEIFLWEHVVLSNNENEPKWASRTRERNKKKPFFPPQKRHFSFFFFFFQWGKGKEEEIAMLGIFMRGKNSFRDQKFVAAGEGKKREVVQCTTDLYSSAICEGICSSRRNFYPLVLNLFLLMLAKKMAATAHVQNILFGPFVEKKLRFCVYIMFMWENHACKNLQNKIPSRNFVL